jgi:hypothetical protein
MAVFVLPGSLSIVINFFPPQPGDPTVADRRDGCSHFILQLVSNMPRRSRTPRWLRSLMSSYSYKAIFLFDIRHGTTSGVVL